MGFLHTLINFLIHITQNSSLYELYFLCVALIGNNPGNKLHNSRYAHMWGGGQKIMVIILHLAIFHAVSFVGSHIGGSFGLAIGRMLGEFIATKVTVLKRANKNHIE